MSNLKHLSVDELRGEVHRISTYRAKLECEAQINEEAARILVKSAGDLRVKAHNAGQREAWARIYLAQKT